MDRGFGQRVAAITPLENSVTTGITQLNGWALYAAKGTLHATITGFGLQ